MLVRINPKTHTTSQMSIPRDMRVEIAGHGYDKINTAYFWGGGALAIKTVEEFTGIPVNHIVLVDFKGFRKLIDSVGGVWVDIPKTITSWYSGDREVSFRKGHRLLSGRRALIYARIRKVDDDFHRMARQQQVVQGLRAQIVKPGNLWHVSTIAEDFMRGIATELTTNQLIALAYLQWRTDPKHQYKLLMSGTPQYIGGGAYVAPDSAANKRTIRQFLSH
jgi:LCP family protein required for cell wall assembly